VKLISYREEVLDKVERDISEDLANNILPSIDNIVWRRAGVKSDIKASATVALEIIRKTREDTQFYSLY